MNEWEKSQEMVRIAEKSTENILNKTRIELIRTICELATKLHESSSDLFGALYELECERTFFEWKKVEELKRIGGINPKDATEHYVCIDSNFNPFIGRVSYGKEGVSIYIDGTDKVEYVYDDGIKYPKGMIAFMELKWFEGNIV